MSVNRAAAYRCGGLAALVATALWAQPGPAQARHHRHSERAAAEEPAAKPTGHHGSRHEASPTEAAQQALAAGDSAGAYQTIEQAYRTRPAAELLFWLGRIAEAEKHPVAAQDYMRRYLLETSAGKDEAAAAQRAQAQKLADQPSDGSAEARIAGPKGGLLFIDDRLAGTLPLPASILLAAGPHRVGIETKRKRLDGKVEITAGRGIEVLFDLEASAVLVSQQPLVLVVRLDRPERGVTAPDPGKLTAATQEAISKARCSAVQTAEALRVAPDFRGCLSEVDCALRLADKNSLDYALRLEVESKPGTAAGAAAGTAPGAAPGAAKDRTDTRISAAVLDVAVGAVAAQTERTCSGCASEAVAASLREAVAQVLEQGLGRPRGTLLVETEPTGAEVKIDGRMVGTAPLRRDVLAGEHTVDLSAAGQKPASQRIRIEPSTTKTLRVLLAEDGKPSEPAPAAASAATTYRSAFYYPRPRWRFLAGGAAIGVGVVLAGLGISALAINGQCQTPAVPPMTTCGYLFSTGALGGGLLGAGLVLSLSGTGLILWPGPRPDSGAVRLPATSTPNILVAEPDSVPALLRVRY